MEFLESRMTSKWLIIGFCFDSERLTNDALNFYGHKSAISKGSKVNKRVISSKLQIKKKVCFGSEQSLKDALDLKGT